jgi:hypothetical protein
MIGNGNTVEDRGWRMEDGVGPKAILDPPSSILETSGGWPSILFATTRDEERSRIED